MEAQNIKERLAQIEAELSALPRGSVTTKMVKGHSYFYHRWYEEKARKERYVSEAEADALREQLARRKELEAQRKELLRQLPPEPKQQKDAPAFITLMLWQYTDLIWIPLESWL